ncbi:hypothetical protein HDV05_008040, partial [Chytridiales sp. JEL 0842]
MAPPPPIPEPQILKSEARSVDIAWSYSHQDAGLLRDLPAPTFQLLKSESHDPEFFVVYEGKEMRVMVENLKPET